MPKKFKIDMSNEVKTNEKDIEKLTKGLPKIYPSNLEDIVKEEHYNIVIRVPKTLKNIFVETAKKEGISQKLLFIKMMRKYGCDVPNGIEKLDKRRYYKI